MKKILPLLIILLLFSCKTTYITNVIDLYQVHNMLFMNITFNGQKTRLLIDTGASKSLLDITKAEEYGFDYILLSKDQYVGLGGREDVYILWGYDVKPIHITFLGTDLSEVTGHFRELDNPIIGVLGADFLENHDAKIDFKNKKIYLHDSDTIEVEIITDPRK